MLVLAAVQGASCGGLAASLGFVARAAPTWGSDARRTGCLRPAAAHAEGSPTSGANAWRTGRVRSAVVLLRAGSPNDSVPPKRSFVSRLLGGRIPPRVVIVVAAFATPTRARRNALRPNPATKRITGVTGRARPRGRFRAENLLQSRWVVRATRVSERATSERASVVDLLEYLRRTMLRATRR